MAAPTLSDIVTFITTTVEQLCAKENIIVRRIQISKYDNQINKGDLFLSKGCLVNDVDIILLLKDELMTRCRTANIPVENVTNDKYHSLVFHLCRPRFFTETIDSILKNGSTYGQKSQASDCPQTVVLNSEYLTRTVNSQETSLDDIRALLIQMHAVRLLTSNGYKVDCLAREIIPVSLAQIMTKLAVGEDLFIKNSTPTDGEVQSQRIFLVKHPCVELSDNLEVSSGQVSPETEDKAHPSQSSNILSYHFNLRKYLQEQGFQVGSTQYDKNLNLCNITTDGVESDVCQQAGFLHKCIKSSSPSVCIHIVSQSKKFNQQKVQLLLHALSNLPEQSFSNQMSQSLCVYGPVVPGKGRTSGDKLTAHQYISSRYDQMKQAAVSKYGSAVRGRGWDSNLRELTAACIKFEMLSTSPRSQVKINMSSETAGDIYLPGAFAMYNCARLATLFSRFDEEVSAGTYPKLPDIAMVDFSLLREEQEWGLMWIHLCTFPEVVKASVSHLVAAGTIHAGLHTYKICQFLTTLSQAFSSYYSRYHVLGEGRPQLLPTMYARIYLLKAVHQVFINGLALLNIQPLSQL